LYIVGRYETVSEQGFQVSGFSLVLVFSLLTPYMNYIPATALESEQLLMIIATKPTKKIRNIIFISV
jgi:hypothetical protein